MHRVGADALPDVRRRRHASLEADDPAGGLRAGATPANAARKAFGDVPAFERQFRSYISRFTFPPSRTRCRRTDTAMQARALPPAEALAVQATVNAVVRRRRPAKALASQAVGRDGSLPDGWLATARAARRAGDSAAAEAALARRSRSAPPTPLSISDGPNYGCRPCRADHPLDDVAAALERSLALKADLARAMSMLGYVRARQDAKDPRGFELTRQAVLLEPGNVRHYLAMAAVMYARGDPPSTPPSTRGCSRSGSGTPAVATSPRTFARRCGGAWSNTLHVSA